MLAQLQWRRYGAIFALLLGVFLWFSIAEPALLIMSGVPMQRDALLDALPLAKGATVVLFAVVFTLRGSWGRNGFVGGVALVPWLALWPFWGAAIILLILNGAAASLDDHLTTIVFAFSIGFSEEAIFRGALFRALMPGGPRSAILWSSLWFAAFHLLNFPEIGWRMALLTALATFIVGLAFGWVRWAAASIWPCILAHAFYDYACLVGSDGWQLPTLSTELVMSEVVFMIVALAWTGWLFTRKVTPGELSWAVLDPLSAWRRRPSAIALDEGRVAS